LILGHFRGLPVKEVQGMVEGEAPGGASREKHGKTQLILLEVYLRDLFGARRGGALIQCLRINGGVDAQTNIFASPRC